jgi:hypothetical protein
MEEHIIIDDDGKGYTKAFIGTDVEFVDPIQHYSNWNKRKYISLTKDMLFLENPFMASLVPEEFYIKKAEEKWAKRYEIIINTEVPGNFLKLLTCESKKGQIQLLKGQGLSPMQLIAFIFKAWTDFGFSFSSYTAKHYNKGLDESRLPELITVKDGDVKKAGETNFTKGQLKSVVNDRKVTVSKFIDKGDNWHCFFLTYRSLRGEESWKDGQPHFHYISDKWGYPRKDAVEQLRGQKYPSTTVHIDLSDYK